MSKKSSTISIFFFLCFLSICIFFLSKISFLSPINNLISFFTSPIQQSFYQVSHDSKEVDNTVALLTKENDTLRKRIIDQKKIETENNALKDQFMTTKPTSQELLPATVLGAPGFLPGVSLPEVLILNKGKVDGVLLGNPVIVKDSLIGIISKVSQNTSVVSLLVSSDISFTAKTLETQAVGVVKAGVDTELALENVLLSQNLKRGDLVITKGDVDKESKGFPPDLLVGRIVAVDRKPSALFQTARIKSLVDVANLTTVFIMPKYK